MYQKMLCSAVQALMSRNIILIRILILSPESIKQELHIMCVLYTEDIGGILTLEFDDNGSLLLKQRHWILMPCMMMLKCSKIKQLQTEKKRTSAVPGNVL